MAIIKQARNIEISVDKEYVLIVKGDVIKISNSINIESQHEDLVLNYGKKINVEGNK